MRWWDHWLKDVENGVLDGPMVQTWLQESVPPSTSYEDRPGRWVGEARWPSPHVKPSEHALAPHRIARPGEDVPEVMLEVSSPLSVGQFAGKWASYRARRTCPTTSAKGLAVSADRPVAMVAARLSDVAPDGRATRVTYGLLNLTRRDGHEEPKPMEPGQVCEVEFELNGVAQAFPAGHRFRLSLSTSYWPLAWPPPEPVTLSVHAGLSSLTLPVRPMAESDEVPANPFGQSEGPPPLTTTELTPPEQRWEVSRDLVAYHSALDIVKNSGAVRYDDIDLSVTRDVHERYTWVADRFCSPVAETEWVVTFERGDWSARSETSTRVSSTPEEFMIDACLDAYHGDRRIVSRNWHHTVPRDLI
ncbi:CocE/NonD family hydrolase C-terminal non-catalytic domain-containing protein [Amycolatopsis sp. NPDC051373]|uniref:CocE/NonD family hydrolase C-terminal non-catalytic domain-containing protein n=1 Tax=Amycolatopsis sp. NPDC051373 TaxID=3155801 RepID=UPI00344F0F90